MEDETVELDFDEEEYNREKEEAQERTDEKYEGCVKGNPGTASQSKRNDAGNLKYGVYRRRTDTASSDCRDFREVIIEFLTAGTIDIGALQNEQSDYLMDASDGFVLNEMLLGPMEDREFRKIGRCLFFPMEDSAHVYFKNVMDENGNRRNFRDVPTWDSGMRRDRR